MQNNTIAAISTPPGRGGIAVIRLSGPQSIAIGQIVFCPRNAKKPLPQMQGYTAAYGSFMYRGNAFDDGIATLFRAPHSYTGEDVLEFSCHGGEWIASTLLQACVEAGAQPAGPGEFTRCAVMNGKLSLTQAEAVMELISATSRQGAAAAHAAMEGALYGSISQVRGALISLAAHLAAYIDYPEEDVETLTAEAFLATLHQQQQALNTLIDGYQQGSLLRNGVNTAIVGSPNVGKSTLFNLLSGFERAIVTPVAGTTRDVLRESIQMEGVTLHLADTAGLHQALDAIEQEGIRRSYEEIKKAGFVMAVFDGSQPLTDADHRLMEMCKGLPALAVLNKSDLGLTLSTDALAPYFTKLVVVSAKEESTRDILQQAVLEVLHLQQVDPNALLLANQRQLAAAVRARDALAQAADTLQAGITFDAAGVFLDDALYALAELTGEDATQTLLDEVFSTFCVGK